MVNKEGTQQDHGESEGGREEKVGGREQEGRERRKKRLNRGTGEGEN